MNKMFKCMTLMMFFIVMGIGLAQAATLNLKATWDANTETDVVGYKLYRTDAGRTLVGTILGRTTVLYNFSVTVADQSTGTLVFVLTAYDANNESPDCLPASYNYNLDTPPAAPGHFGVIKQ